MAYNKPLNGEAYGSIPHLPGSKFGNRDDKGVDEKAAKFFIDKPGKKSLIIVLEKLDGSSVSVANVDGEILALTRSGYMAISSKYLQHRFFDTWVHDNIEKFNNLKPGERICGEWLAQAHGTLYKLQGDPFVSFDLFIGSERQPYTLLNQYCNHNDLDYAPIIYWEYGAGCPISDAMNMLGDNGFYGALEKPEGCVWRWERESKPVMMAKFVRPDKVIGKYLESISGKDAIWNWKPGD